MLLKLSNIHCHNYTFLFRKKKMYKNQALIYLNRISDNTKVLLDLRLA